MTGGVKTKVEGGSRGAGACGSGSRGARAGAGAGGARAGAEAEAVWRVQKREQERRSRSGRRGTDVPTGKWRCDWMRKCGGQNRGGKNRISNGIEGSIARDHKVTIIQRED